MGQLIKFPFLVMFLSDFHKLIGKDVIWKPIGCQHYKITRFDDQTTTDCIMGRISIVLRQTKLEGKVETMKLISAFVNEMIAVIVSP